MEYLILLVIIFGIIGLCVDWKELDAQEYRNRVRKSIEKDAQWQIGRTWIVQGQRRDW